MSFIGKNIKKIRSIKKLSQTAFADIFNISRTSVGAYEEGRAEPKIETIISIANYFSISIDTLLTKDLTVNELYKFDIFNSKYGGEEGQERPLPPREIHTPYVSIEDTIEYLTNFGNKDYIFGLPTIQLPGATKETTRAFEMNSHGMEYHDAGLFYGDIIFCAAVKKEYDLLHIGSVYTLVTHENIVTRRLVGKKETLLFKGDNANYPQQEFSLDQIREIWEVRGHYSTHITAPSMLDVRVQELENSMKELMDRLSKLEK